MAATPWNKAGAASLRQMPGKGLHRKNNSIIKMRIVILKN
jgi:hypothetical protein